MIAIKIRLIVLPYSTAVTGWEKAEWRWTKLKVILLLSACERIRCFISLRPHQHITGFGTKVTTEGHAWSIHHRGSRHPSLPPFKRVGLTLWFHSHSHWESVSGKAGYDSVEFSHLCTYQQIKGGASVTPARNRLLDLDCSCWLSSLVGNTLCFTRPSSGFVKILLRRRVHKTWS